MMRLLSISAAVAVLGASLSLPARAEERDRERGRMHESCSMITKCHRDDGRRVCRQERVCKMVRDRR